MRRLHTHWIDLHQVHRPDHDTDSDSDSDSDSEETLSTLTDPAPRREVPRVRILDVPRSRGRRGAVVSERRALGHFVSEQPLYSILVRGVERDLLPVAERYGLGVLPWSPLAGLAHRPLPQETG
jgi:aryl-alcohol dehydrogenase-like predicted oxidoreductase